MADWILAFNCSVRKDPSHFFFVGFTTAVLSFVGKTPIWREQLTTLSRPSLKKLKNVLKKIVGRGSKRQLSWLKCRNDIRHKVSMSRLLLLLYCKWLFTKSLTISCSSIYLHLLSATWHFFNFFISSFLLWALWLTGDPSRLYPIYQT